MNNKISDETSKDLVSLLNNNSFETLSNKTSELLKEYPKSIFLLNLNGIANTNLKNYPKALKSFEKVLLINNKSADALYNLGNLNQIIEKFEIAKEFYNKTLLLDENYFKAYNNLGIIAKIEKNFQQAEIYFKKAINLNERYPLSLLNLGKLYLQQYKNEEALSLFIKSYLINRNNDSLISIGNSLVNYKFNKSNKEIFEILFILINKKNLVSPRSIIKSVISLIKHEDKIKSFLDPSFQINSISQFEEIVSTLSKYNFFIEIIKQCPLTDIQLENFFTKIRYFILKNAFKIKNSNLIESFQIALSYLCYINEFVFFKSDIEESLLSELESNIISDLNSDNQPNQVVLLSFSSYKDLNNFEWSNKIFFQNHLEDLEKLIFNNKQIENQNKKIIKRIKNLEDNNSVHVRNQYEENPYPRWIYTKTIFKKNSLNKIIENNELNIFSSKIKSVLNPNILIAGCGTGQHAIYTALNFKNSKITATDLSLSSLAYAKRKADELSISNIDFIQLDILDTDFLKQKFDLIECVGVLHHMNDPFRGWQVLVNNLIQGGIINIGLYSKYARQHILKIRKDIENKSILVNNKNIRDYRKYIIDVDSPENISIRSSKDFYSISNMRDLLFHVKEHQFDLMQIKNYLDKLNLFFCGFEKSVLFKLFSSFNHSKLDIYDLSKWNDFEKKFPNSFDGMYQFYCQKK